MKNLSMIALMTCVAVGLGSCTDTVTEDVLAPAWQAFQDGNYADAHAQFATFEATEGTPAVIGLGWTTLKMDSLPESNRYFTLVSNDTSVTDNAIWAYAGWSIVSWAQKNFPAAASRAAFVLRQQATFELPFYAKITERTMLLIEAYGYFHGGNPNACLAVIQLLDPDFASTTDPKQLLDKLDALSIGELQ